MIDNDACILAAWAGSMNAFKEWKELQDQSALYRAVKFDQEESYWSKYAANYDCRRHCGNGLHDELEIVLPLMSRSARVLEIGAGTGAYTLAMAKNVETVTALEPSAAMAGILKQKTHDQNIKNVTISQKRWEESRVAPHDIVVAAGCLYVFYDLERVLSEMVQYARQSLILVCGVNNFSHIYEEPARLLGSKSPPNGPDYVHVYNALYQMGHHANASIISSQRSLIYDNMDHAVETFIDRMQLPSDKADSIRTYLANRLKPLPSGKLTLGDIPEKKAILWCYPETADWSSAPSNSQQTT